MNVSFARGAGMSLMVWEDTRASLTGTQGAQGYSQYISDVYAARIDDAGNMIDTLPIRVAAGPFSQTAPKAAWNGQSWLVVWTSRTPSPFSTTQGVYAARVSAAGQVIDDPAILVADNPNFDEREIVVASDDSGWAVIWKGGIAFAVEAVQGRLISPAGVPDATRTFFTTSGGVGYYIPWNFEMAYAGGRYLFVSEHMRPSGSDDDIFGQLFDTSLTKVGNEFRISSNTWNQNRAAIASNGSDFLVTWYDAQQWGEVRVSPVTPAGAVVVTDGVVLETGMYGSDPYATAGWDGVHWLAAWDGTGGIKAAQLTSAGAILAGSPFAVRSTSAIVQRPAIATQSAGALVVWSDGRNSITQFGPETDVYGSFVSTSATVSPNQPLTLSVPAQTRPDLAGNAASGYLVSFLSQTAGTASVMAQRVDRFGQATDSQPIVVATGTRAVRNPTVAWNGSLWLIVWEVLNPSGAPSGTGTVWGRRVGTNGVAIDAAPFLVMPGNTPDVAAAGDVFLVVSSDPQPSTHYRAIKGMRVRGSDAVLLDGTPSVVLSSYAIEPCVTGFADRWLVACEQHPSHDSAYSTIMAAFVLAAGTPQGQFTAGSTSLTNMRPGISSGGAVALVAWGDSTNVRARRVQSDGVLLDTNAGLAISSAFNKQFAPSAGWDGLRWFVGFNDYRAQTSLLGGALGDVYGTGVQADGTVDDPNGIAIANDLNVPEATPSIAGELGVSAIGFAAFRLEQPFGTFRIALRSQGGGSTVDAFCFGDGTGTACPCGNAGASGRGCGNSVDPTGARLATSGFPSVSNDTLVLLGSGMPDSSVLYFQGTAQMGGGLGVVFGDGLRCAGGTLIRLGIESNSGGVSQYPGVGDPSISVRGAVPPAGGTRTYQGWYRNAASFCTASAFNLTNGLNAVWTP